MTRTTTQPARGRRRRFSFKPFLRLLEPFFSVIIITLVVGVIFYGLFTVYNRSLRPYTIVIAAGSPTGESFLISRALEEALEARLGNVDVRVDATDGTEANLTRLETGEAAFGAAQADIINNYGDDIDTAQARAVAVLYTDNFQLLACNPAITSFPTFLQRLRDRSVVEVVHVPLLGGQRLSFQEIAEHFGLREGEHYTFSGDAPGACGAENANKLIFRVRIAGNQEVANYLNAGWNLIPIEQVEAMRLKNAAFQPASIPAGTYAGAGPGDQLVPVPATDLQTIGVQRVLLARADVPDWIVYEATAILNQASQELAEDLLSYGDEITSTDPDGPYRRYIEDFVVPLLPNIATQNQASATAVGTALHPGAYSFYSPNESWFTWFNDNADGIGLGLTAVTLGGSLLLGLNRAVRRGRKDTADGYLKEMAYLKGFGRGASATTADEETTRFQQQLAERFQHYQQQHPGLRIEPLPPDNDELDSQLIGQLIDGACRTERLAQMFDEASRALDEERISEESFHTFTSTYKATREAIEQHNEELRRAISLYYVNQTMKLLDPSRQRIATQENLDFIRGEASRVLTDELVFSRESFRTYIDAYTLAKETVASRRGVEASRT